MTYHQYFRLKGPPFQAASPDAAVYFSPTHLQGLATLESGLSGELTGLTLLTGEVGTGKTTLIYSLLQRDYKRVRIAHIEDSKLSFLEIMRLILAQLNLYSVGSTKLDYLEALDRFLKLRDREERIAIVVDEAQALSDEVLEELRLLSGHGQRHDRRLQLILVGQPELAERLKKPELRQLNQRISSRAVLKPLNHEQAVNYVECKLSAQGSSCSTIFERGALKCLLRRSDGIPRKINMLCHSALLASFSAGERKVSLKTARKVAAEYHDSVSITQHESGARLLRMMLTLSAGAAFASLLLLGFVYSNVWSDWVPGHSVSLNRMIQQTVRPVDQIKRVETVERTKPVERPGLDGQRDHKTAAAPAADPVEMRASLAPGVASVAAAKTDMSHPAGAQGMPIASAAPAAAPPSAATQKQAAAPAAAEARTRITVRYGDTLEKIAVRYLGSKTGINKLVDANPQLSNINDLSVGEVIYLPPGVTPKAVLDPGAAAQPAPDAQDFSER